MVTGFVVEIFSPSSETLVVESDLSGVASFVVAEDGLSIFKVYRKSFTMEGKLLCSQKTLPIIPIETQTIEEVLGEKA